MDKRTEEIDHKLSDEAEMLFTNYTAKQSKYSAALFYDYSGERWSQIEAAATERDESKAKLKEYIYQLETNLNSIITYYEDEEQDEDPYCMLSDNVDELSKRLHNAFITMHSMNERISTLEKRLNHMFVLLAL